MGNFFDHNIQALLRHAPEAIRLERTLSSKITPIATPCGEPTIRHGTILIHSSYNPVKDGARFADQIRSGDQVFLYGFGLGYHVKAILDRIGEKGNLTVLELNPAILSSAMILRDQTSLLKDPRLKVLFGMEELEISSNISHALSELTRDSRTPPKILFHHPSYKCLPQRFPNLSRALEVLMMERRFPAVLGDLEIVNQNLNDEIIRKCPGINSLKGIHSSRPGILVGAGPSLDDLLPFLKRLTKTAIIASVDTALPILRQNEIDPQYVFTIDPQEESFRYFSSHLNSPSRLIFIPSAHPWIVLNYEGEKFVVFKEDGMNEPNPDAREKGITLSGGSVSCLGLECVIRMGCDPVFLVGQDCAYSGNFYYSRHSENNLQLQDRIHQSNTLFNGHREKAGTHKQISVTGVTGSSVFTNHAMFSYKRTLEQIATLHPETRVINLCSHGANIENVTSIGSVRELIRFFPVLKDRP